MENQSIIRERHGIANARKVPMARIEGSYIQHVLVTDGHGEVLLSLGSSNYPAGLTPEQARMIAAQLNSAAERIENRESKP